MPRPVVFLGADHAGFHLKEQIKPQILKQGYKVIDASSTFVEGDDYPAPASIVAHFVSKTPGSRGVLVCGSGIGVTIAANRVKSIRAFDAFDEKTVKLAREHADANVMSLSGWRLTMKESLKLLDIFFNTPFSKAARHHRRVKQLG